MLMKSHTKAVKDEAGYKIWDSRSMLSRAGSGIGHEQRGVSVWGWRLKSPQNVGAQGISGLRSVQEHALCAGYVQALNVGQLFTRRWCRC